MAIVRPDCNVEAPPVVILAFSADDAPSIAIAGIGSTEVNVVMVNTAANAAADVIDRLLVCREIFFLFFGGISFLLLKKR